MVINELRKYNQSSAKMLSIYSLSFELSIKIAYYVLPVIRPSSFILVLVPILLFYSLIISFTLILAHTKHKKYSLAAALI